MSKNKIQSNKTQFILLLVCLILFQFSFSLASKNNLKLKNKQDESPEMQKKKDANVDKYFAIVRSDIKSIWEDNKLNDTISLEIFSEVFNKGKYAQIAKNFVTSKIINAYYKNFKYTVETMTAFQFEPFYMMYYLEGELLVANKHPTLSSKFPNKENLFEGKMSEAAEGFFWNIHDNLRSILHSHGIKPETRYLVDAKTIFKIYSKTRFVKNLKKKDHFSEETIHKIIKKGFNFFNLIGDNERKGLDNEELLHSYIEFYIFEQLYHRD